MRKLILLAVLLALIAGGGCKRVKIAANNNPAPQPQPQPQQAVQDDQPKIHPAGIVIPPKQGGGGGGGAAQAVKQAAIRTVNLNDLNQIRTFITTMAIDGMPTRDELAQALGREAPNLYKLWVTDQTINVPATLRDDGVWAYTVTAQSQAGEHLVVTRSSVGRMSLADLQQRLKE